MNYPIGFIVALTREAQTIQTGVKSNSEIINLNNNSKLIVSGMGYDRARLSAEHLIKAGCKCLISWGSCAALSPELNIGDIIIPKTLINSSNKPIDLIPNTLPTEVFNHKFVKINKAFLHLDSVITSENEKKRLHINTGAVAGDMESLAVIEAAQQYEIDYSIVRAVSDTTKTVIPYKITQHITPYGDLVFPDFYKALLFNPSSIIELIQLGKGFQSAMSNLSLIKNIILKN